MRYATRLVGDGQDVLALAGHLQTMAEALVKTVRRPRERELAFVVRGAARAMAHSDESEHRAEPIRVLEHAVERAYADAKARDVEIVVIAPPAGPAAVETNAGALLRAITKRLECALAVATPESNITVMLGAKTTEDGRHCSLSVHVEPEGDESPLLMEGLVVREPAHDHVVEERRRCLLVEPSGVLAECIAAHLATYGFDAEHAPNGDDARARLEERRFDLAVVDAAIDEAFDEDVSRRLGAAGTPTLLIADREILRRPVFAHHHAILSRPIPWSRFSEAVGRALGKKLRAASSSSSDLWPDGPSPKRGTRILVVEDSETNRRLITRVLQHSGHPCDVAADGNEAIEACKQVAYDLVLMDVRMPTMNGYDATRSIRRALGPSPPIVALTGDTSDEVREACEACGMNDFLAKPVDPAALMDVLVRFLD